MYAEVTKSTKPLIVTFGAGAWAELGVTAVPRMASIARTTTPDALIVASSGVAWSFLERLVADPGTVRGTACLMRLEYAAVGSAAPR
jgi:hypothetical protein